MKARLRMFLALGAVLSMLLVATPANANHALNFTCDDPNPNGASANGDARCTFTTHRAGEKVTTVRLDLPIDAKINEDEDASNGGDNVTDPADGAKVGQSVIATDLSFDGCGDANDGGTYSTYWEDTWRAYTVPTGWTKVAEFNTVFRVLFFFTEHVPTHIIKNNTTGQYAAVTPIPDRGCSGAVTDWDITTYGTASDGADVGTNPSANGCYTVDLSVTYSSGTVATDSDDISVGGATC